MNFIAVESGGRILIVATSLIFFQFNVFNQSLVQSTRFVYHCHALNHLILYYKQRYIHKKTHKLYRMFTEPLNIYTMFTETVSHSCLVLETTTFNGALVGQTVQKVILVTGWAMLFNGGGKAKFPGEDGLIQELFEKYPSPAFC